MRVWAAGCARLAADRFNSECQEHERCLGQPCRHQHKVTLARWQVELPSRRGAHCTEKFGRQQLNTWSRSAQGCTMWLFGATTVCGVFGLSHSMGHGPEALRVRVVARIDKLSVSQNKTSVVTVDVGSKSCWHIVEAWAMLIFSRLATKEGDDDSSGDLVTRDAPLTEKLPRMPTGH